MPIDCHTVLNYLAVHPDHQGQGIATLLVEHGLKTADKLGLDVFVVGMKAALNVYLRTGFALLGEIVQDDSSLGGEGDVWTYFLERTITNGEFIEPIRVDDRPVGV
jgi:GNAT superfamily N-acetyltransferase